MKATSFATALVLALACSLSLPAAAQDYPSKPIRLVVPFPPGGAADAVARFLATEMATTLGQPVVVDNRGGASGNIGMNAVAKSAADGYTILFASASLAINKSLIKDTPFDPQRDFTPISLVVMVPSIMVVAKDLPATTVQEVVALSKAKPATLNYASVGIGTTQHLAGVMLRLKTGADLTHVSYKGQDQLVPDLVSGRVHVAFNNISAVQGQIAAGQLKPIAVALPQRWPGLPDVPTFAEAGFPGFEISSWLALFGPAGLPAPIAEKLSEAARRAVANRSLRDRIVQGGNQPVGGSPAELSRFLEAEIARWAQAITASGAKSD